MNIGIRLLTNRIVLIENVDPTDTFNDILNRSDIKKIKQKEKTDKLKYNGEIIRNNNLELMVYNIQHNDVIIMYENKNPLIDIKNIFFNPVSEFGTLNIILSIVMIAFLFLFDIFAIFLFTCGNIVKKKDCIQDIEENKNISFLSDENNFLKFINIKNAGIILILTMNIIFLTMYYKLF